MSKEICFKKINPFSCPLDIIFQAKYSQLFANMNNVDQRNVGAQTGTLPSDWKQGDCFNELGEL